jgi:hypothetical protein
MVQRTWDDNRLLWRALAASLGAHLLLALFLPVWTGQFSGGLQPIEAISFAPIVRVQIQRPSAQSLPAAVPRTVHRAPVVSFAHSRAELTAPRHKPSARPLTQNGPSGQVAAAPKLVAQRQTPLFARPTASAGVSTRQAAAAPTPQPQASQANYTVNGNGESDRGGTLPLGGMQPPTLDPGVRAELQQRFGVHVTLVVTVDEDGHTKAVEFQPPLDAQTEIAIKALLANASWDAAVCGGGVSCEGKATIKL